MLTYSKCKDLLGVKDKIKLERNTYLIKNLEGNTIVFKVKFYSTNILTIYDNGFFKYNTNRWFTVSTKARLNRYGPVKVYQKNKIWYINGIPFKDNLIYDSINNNLELTNYKGV